MITIFFQNDVNSLNNGLLLYSGATMEFTEGLCMRAVVFSAFPHSLNVAIPTDSITHLQITQNYNLLVIIRA
jgi:hypothetical protein